MKHRETWRAVLDAQIKLWEAKSWTQLVAELSEEVVYQIEFKSKQFQVEAHLVENTDEYIHVCVSVDDGTLPASLRPLSSSFIRRKASPK